VSGFLVAVDYGTVNTVAVLRRPDGQVRPLLVDGLPLLPSAACVGLDGRLLAGRDAENAGRVNPGAFVLDPRSRIDAGRVALGGSVYPVVEVIGTTLARVVQEAVHGTGGVLPRLVLTHPASWDEARRAILTEAGSRTGLGTPTLVPTPVAAAWYQAESVGDLELGRCRLVYHLGAGTFEVSLLRRVPGGYGLLATHALDDVGGVDFDGLLLQIIGAAVPPGATPTWQRLVTPTTTAELRQFMQLCDDVRAAKETLSRQLTVGLRIPLVDQDVHVRRETFERAAEPLLARTVDLAADLLAATGTPVGQVDEVLLLGGSTRIPLVTTLLQRQFGRPPTVCKQPELAVAEGALIAVSRTAATPLGPAAPARAPAEEPTLDLTLGVVPPAAPTPAAGPRPRRRPRRLLGAATGLALIAALAGVVIRQPRHWVPGEPAAASTRATVADTRAAVTEPFPGSSTSPSPDTSARTLPVATSVTVTPARGTCSTDVTFVAHVKVNDPGKYQWRWVFGGPKNYSFVGIYHDLEKSGDLRITWKFAATVSGSYWGRVQITSPVAITSERGTVQLTCGP
jgi:hypothetical protein